MEFMAVAENAPELFGDFALLQGDVVFLDGVESLERQTLSVHFQL